MFQGKIFVLFDRQLLEELLRWIKINRQFESDDGERTMFF